MRRYLLSFLILGTLTMGLRAADLTPEDKLWIQSEAHAYLMPRFQWVVLQDRVRLSFQDWQWDEEANRGRLRLRFEKQEGQGTGITLEFRREEKNWKIVRTVGAPESPTTISPGHLTTFGDRIFREYVALIHEIKEQALALTGGRQTLGNVVSVTVEAVGASEWSQPRPNAVPVFVQLRVVDDRDTAYVATVGTYGVSMPDGSFVPLKDPHRLALNDLQSIDFDCGEKLSGTNKKGPAVKPRAPHLLP